MGALATAALTAAHTTAASTTATPVAARTQMGFSLGWHIILACFGVGLPGLILFAEWRGWRTRDPWYQLLARRWAKALGVLFAVGAVSGTILSFEMGVLWAGLMDHYGSVIGLPFAIEGFAFFIEAIFLGIYLYGWDRLPARTHLLSGIPILIAGIASAFFVVTANSWMNAPRGFTGVASGRVPPGVARGNVITSWLNPTSAMSGALAVVAGMYLAAVYLTADARRAGEPGLAEEFRRRALVSGVAAGLLAAAGIAVVHADAPRLYAGLTGRALPLVAVSAAAGVASLVLMTTRRFVLVRITAGLAVASVLWGWGLAQYPHVLAGMTVGQAAAGVATLQATTICAGAGIVILVPSLTWLFLLFQREQQEQPRSHL